MKEMRNIDSGIQGHTTLRVIRVVKHEREEHDSNEQGPESVIYVTSYTPVYEYTVNGQRYDMRRVWEVLQISIPRNGSPGYYNPSNPADVTESLTDIAGGGSRFWSLLCFVIGALAIVYALVRVWTVMPLL